MLIELYEPRLHQSFEDMFVDYFLQDYSAPFTEEAIRANVVPKYTELSDRSIAPILIATEEDVPVGFINFQIDSEASNWNERPGWGMIRELHVQRQFRNHGVGSILVEVAEGILKDSGATNAYLSADRDLDFWEKLGWTKTDAMAPNGGTIFEKVLD